MKLVVGLGNPGDKYKATRHNAGFWLIERLAAQTGTVLRKDGKFQALVGRHEASGAWLMLPQSFMNSSGRPVQMMASFFKIAPADILIIHDELDLPPGTAKLKQGGGIAGHNGLKDISARLGSHEYWRLRLGIGRPADRQAGVDFVLNRPAQEERAAIDAAIERSLEIMPLVLAGDLQGAMLKLHTREQEEAAAAPRRTDRAAAAEQTDHPHRERAAQAEAPAARARSDAAPAPEIPRTAPEAAAQPEKSNSIEKFSEVVQDTRSSRVDHGDRLEKLEQAQKANRSSGAEEPAPAERKGAFNSLLKKFLPGTDPARKK